MVLTIRERAVASWPTAWAGQNQRDILVSMGYDVDTPWKKLPKKDRDWILYTEERPTVPVYACLTPDQTLRAKKQGLAPSYQGTFIGAKRYVLDTFAPTKSAVTKKRVSQFVTSAPCPVYDSKKLKRDALDVTFEGMAIAEFSRLPLETLTEIARTVSADGWTPVAPRTTVRRRLGPTWRGKAHDDDSAAMKSESGVGLSHDTRRGLRRTPHLSSEKHTAAQRLSADLAQRLQPMIDLGLGYLSLDRTTSTLSGGERQRLRLATQLSSQLFGVVYVLDEPFAGPCTSATSTPSSASCTG